MIANILMYYIERHMITKKNDTFDSIKLANHIWGTNVWGHY